MTTMPKFPKPEDIKVSPELAKGIDDFMRAMIEAGEVIARRANEVMHEIAVSLEKGKR